MKRYTYVLPKMTATEAKVTHTYYLKLHDLVVLFGSYIFIS